MPAVTLPDGSRKEFPQPVSVAEVAQAIGPGLARAALAGKVDGRLVDTSYVIDRDCQISVVKGTDPEGLGVLRHSCAHLLAQAVKSLFPSAQVTIGPVIDDGFYYDFAYERTFTPEDLEAIEAKMREFAKSDFKVTRSLLARDDAVVFFRSLGEHYKAEI
ncbi:MAG: TGS domain-containing protein, partial [Gammaproteobacteria bacterium]